MFKRLFRNKVKDDLKLLNRKHMQLMEVLETFNNSGKNKPINREDLTTFPLFVWIELNSKVKVRRRNMLFDDYLNFDTIIFESGSIGNHFHQDIIESIEVIYGKIIDRLSGKEYKKGDVVYYKKNECHEIDGIEKSFLKVIFKP